MNDEGREKLICFFLPSLVGGGVERVIVNLANQFAKNGYSVDIVLWSGGVDSPYISELNGTVNVVSLRGPQRQYNLILKGVAALFSVGKVVRYINRARPSVLFASTCELVAILANELSEKRSKIVVMVHSDPSDSSALLMHRGSRFRLRFFSFLSRRLYPKADWVTCVSKGVADGVARRGLAPEDKIGFIHNPAVTRSLKEKSSEPPVHPWLVKKEHPIFVGVGRLSEEKNFSLLLRAFALVMGSKADARMIIIGDGELRPELEKLRGDLDLSSRVDFTGFLQNPFAVMANADVLVLSSNVEGLPNVIIEAMACGCQIVSTNCPSGPAEILEDGKYGRLTPMGDETALSEAMLEALTSPIDRRLILERAEFFNEDRIGEQYIALCGKLTGN
jgi:glycosyltransferase involved in cell wall biosynthesis